MAIQLVEGFSRQSLENLKGIASQAFGHRIGEKSKGGMGYMGVMTKADGTKSVFKCLTHSDEYKAFEKANDMYVEYADDLQAASESLRALLLDLGEEAGVNRTELEDILDAYTGKADYLSRKMVAKAVTLIAKHAVVGGDSDKFWKEVSYSGFVEHTKLKERAEDDENSIAFDSDGVTTHITDLKFGAQPGAAGSGGLLIGKGELFAKYKEAEDKFNQIKDQLANEGVGALSAADSDELTTGSDDFSITIGELETRLTDKDGDIGERMIKLLREAISQVESQYPAARDCFVLAEALMINPDAKDSIGRETLAKPKLNPYDDKAWDDIRIKMFKLSLSRSLDAIKAEHGDGGLVNKKDILRLFRRAFVRSGYAYAGLKTACDIAALRKLKCRFQGFLFEKKYDEEKNVHVLNETQQDRIIEIALRTMDEKLDEPAPGFDSNSEVDTLLAGGIIEHEVTELKSEENKQSDLAVKPKRYEQYEATEADKSAIKARVTNAVEFVYSNVKVIYGEDKEITNDDKQSASLNEEDYKFVPPGATYSYRGDVIAGNMFD